MGGKASTTDVGKAIAEGWRLPWTLGAGS